MTPEDHTAPPPPDSDVMLVQRTLGGEQRAFELLVIKYQRRVERLIGRMVRHWRSSVVTPSSTPGSTGSR